MLVETVSLRFAFFLVTCSPSRSSSILLFRLQARSKVKEKELLRFMEMKFVRCYIGKGKE